MDQQDAEMDKIIGFPEVSGTFEGETLFLSGANSPYVQREARPQIKALFPNAKFAKIPGAGHWVQQEAPGPCNEALEAFLRDL